MYLGRFFAKKDVGFPRGLAFTFASSRTVSHARGQLSNARRKIGYIHPATIDPASPVMSILRPRWRELGYVDGETILLRSAQGDITRLPALVAELLGRGVDVLIVVGPQTVRAAREATSVTPIIAMDLKPIQ
jgi:putative ABC transport system substrate-binding protein